MTGDWLLPALCYVVAAGALGVVIKLALRSGSWQEVVAWLGLSYAAIVAVLLVSGDAEPQLVHDTFWAVVSAALVIGTLVILFLALDTGEASKVVPVSASYPAVTLVLSTLVLSERVSVADVAGVVLIVAGVAVLTSSA